MSPNARLGAFLGALVLAALTTAGTQACDPPWALAIGLVLLGAAGVALAGRSRAAAVLGLLALSLLPVARVLAVDGLPYTHDGAAHGWRIWAAAQVLADGEWPRWLPRIGLGLPTLQFYPPIAYVGPMLAMLAGMGLPDALSLGAWLPGIVGAAGVAWVLRDRGAAAATLGAAVFLLAPFRLLDAGYRHALGELWGLALLLPFWHLARKVLRGDGGGPGLAVVSAGLALAHPVSGLMALWALPWLAPKGAHRRLPALALTGLLGAAMAGAHLVPSLVEARHVRLADAVPGAGPWLGYHALSAPTTLQRTRWEGRQLVARRGEAEAGPAMPTYVGLGLMAPVLLTLVRREEDSVWARAAVWCWACSLHPLATGIGYLGVLAPIQFPFRLLGPASVAAIPVFVAWTAPLLQRHRWAAPVLVLGLAFDAAPAFGAPSWMEYAPTGITRHRLVSGPPGCRTTEWGWEATQEPLPEVPQRRSGWAGDATGDVPVRVKDLLMPPARLDVAVANVWRVPPELWTDAAVEAWRDGVTDDDRQALRDVGVAWSVANGRARGKEHTPRSRARLINQGFEHDLAAAVRRDGSALTLTLPDGHPGGRLVWVEQAFPGWRVRVDGGDWSAAGQDRGRLAVDVPAEAQTVEFRYTSATPARRLGQLASVLGLVGLIGWRRR